MNIAQQLLFYIGITQVALVEADFLLMIRIHDFSTICDECGTKFRYCVQEFDESEECQWSYAHAQPGIRLDFSQEFLLLQCNPLAFWGQTEKWKGAQIRVAALDEYASVGSNLLYEAQLNLTTDNIQVGVETTQVTYTGPMGHSNITISFILVCAEHWFGRHCNFWCLEESCECDLPVPCHNNCVGVVCGENRHCVDGVDEYVCTCDQGFTGRECEINIDECEGVNCSGNGKCIDGVDSFQCECDSDYVGVLCEITNTASNGLDDNALHFLIPGVIGWVLFIILGMVVVVALVYARSKRKDNSGIQMEECQTSTNASTSPKTTQKFHPGQNTLDIGNEQIHKNISYRATAPFQLPGAAATRVITSHGINVKMTRNCAYQTGGYDYVN